MKRRLLLLNLALAAAAALLVYRLQDHYREVQAGERKVLAAKAAPVPVPKIAARPAVSPVSPAQYAVVAQKTLFSPDRNPDVIIPPPAKVEKPVPPFPAAEGVMIFGDVPPTIILTAKNSKEQRGYQAGDTVGEFKIKSIDGSQVVFEWDGKEYPKEISDLVDKTALPAQAAQNNAPAASAQPVVVNAGGPSEPVVNNVSTTNASGPGVDMGGGYAACQPGDTSPAGTVADGRKKVYVSSPFAPGGQSCHWETTK